jgi:hypothetical protein
MQNSPLAAAVAFSPTLVENLLCAPRRVLLVWPSLRFARRRLASVLLFFLLVCVCVCVCVCVPVGVVVLSLVVCVRVCLFVCLFVFSDILTVCVLFVCLCFVQRVVRN